MSVENVGDSFFRVVGRHWIIEDSGGESEAVPKGSPGVVGHTPVLAPGQRFVYGSGTLLEDGEEGTMWGSLQCEHLPPPEPGSEPPQLGDGEPFDAAIAPFRLCAEYGRVSLSLSLSLSLSCALVLTPCE